MSKTAKILLWILMVVVFTMLLVGGTVYYLYATTDAAAMPEYTLTFGGKPLTQVEADWNVPVLGGVLYKKHTAVQRQAVDLGTFTEATLALTVPQSGASSWNITKDGKTVLSGNAADGGVTHEATFTENGVYAIEAKVTVAQSKNKPYGTHTYRATFTLAAEPKISFSSLKLLQGDVLAVEVSGIMDESVPTIENTLSLAKFSKTDKGYAAYIGVAYNREPGPYDVTVQCGTLTQTQTVTVVHRDFAKQTMTMDSAVADETNNNPQGAVEWRNTIWPLFDIADETTDWDGRFVMPKEGQINTAYGLFRYTNYTNGTSDVERHGGIDIDGEEGDAVAAPAAGRVVYAGNLIYTGNTVVIEHGNGLKSFLYHMSELSVQTGERVAKGQLVGRVGSTGYSTGPHLHYEAKIGNQSIDPMQLFDGTSGIYFKE